MHELVAGYANYASAEAILREQAAGRVLEAGLFFSVTFSFTHSNSISFSI
ncbi:hypothetical protein [Herbidospora yilanensis]|nr:hypothetical protein [Herbidospora yilanensis]